MPVPEFYVLALLAMLGMMILVSANHLLILFLGIELFSLASYAMVALVRNDARCIEAGMKYFLLGAVATAILLYGISLIFGVTHGLNFDAIRQAIPAGTATPLLLTLGMIFVLAGVAFKLGIAPFHLWVPDVYEGAPTSVTLFISTAPKLAAFAALIRIVSEMLPTLATTWQPILIALAVVSMAIGNIGAIVQSNLKRLLAYSSIAHMGYLLLGLISGTARGYAAAMFYMISYSVMTLAAFGMLILLSRAGLEVENIRDLNGLNQRHPWLAFMMLITTFSLAGVPPLVGFIAKVGVLEALLQVHLIWLAVVAILFSVIGAYYYLRIVKVMYFEDTIAEVTMPKIRPDLMTAMTINGIGILLLGVFPGWLFGLTHFAFFGI